MTGVSIEHLVWGGGGKAWYIDQASRTRGYSGSWYAGNVNGVRTSHYGNSLDASDTYYLYHGKFQTQYGVFYLSRHSSNNNISFVYYIDDNGNHHYMSEDKIIVITNTYYKFADIVSHNEYAIYFDVMPASWLSWLLRQSFALTGNYYNLCFVAQSDIDEFLNTYWKYEGGN